MWYNQYFKSVNNVLSANPTTLILSSLVSEFWQRIHIWKKLWFGHLILLYLFSSLSPFLWETAHNRLKYCLKGPLNLKQPTISEKKKMRMGVGVGRGEVEETLNPKQYARLSRDKIQSSNHLHNVKHVVQSTLQNMWITFIVQTLQL